MRSRVTLWSLLGAFLISSSALATELAPTPVGIAIQVKEGNWGTARTQDIETVLGSVVNVLLPHFPRRASDRVVVEHDAAGPRVLFEKSSDGAYRVLLNVRDTRWDQFAYQFSHELCHIFTNFERRDITRRAAIRDHQWFEESLCEAVALFTLDRVASSWERSPPYPRWDDYAPAFREYAQRLLSQRHRRLPPSRSIAEWYKANQRALEGDPYLRQRNEFLAASLLSLLEDEPGSLAAIAYLNLEQPSADKSFRAYLESWYSCCPPQYRALLSRVIALFEERDGATPDAVALTASRRLVR